MTGALHGHAVHPLINGRRTALRWADPLRIAKSRRDAPDGMVARRARGIGEYTICCSTPSSLISFGEEVALKPDLVQGGAARHLR